MNTLTSNQDSGLVIHCTETERPDSTHQLPDIFTNKSSSIAKAFSRTVKGVPDSSSNTAHQMNTRLALAAKEGDFQTVKNLLERDIITVADCGRSLNTAAEQGHTEIVRILLEYGVPANKESCKWQLTPVYRALICQHYDTARLLLEHSQLSVIQAENILSYGCIRRPTTSMLIEKYDAKAIDLILSNYPTTLSTNKAIISVLDHAAKIGDLHTVKILLERHLTIDCNKIYDMLLSRAVNKGHTDVVRILLNYCIPNNKECYNWRSRLYQALTSKHYDIATLLLEHCPLSSSHAKRIFSDFRKDIHLLAYILPFEPTLVSQLTHKECKELLNIYRVPVTEENISAPECASAGPLKDRQTLEIIINDFHKFLTIPRDLQSVAIRALNNHLITTVSREESIPVINQLPIPNKFKVMIKAVNALYPWPL